MPTTPRPLRITVENADELLDAGGFGTGALIQIQSSATETGTYADLTGTGSTPTKALVSGTRSYTAFDPNGDWVTWYRVRYKSADGTRVSVDWSGDSSWATRPGHAPFQAGDETSGQLCSIYDVRQRIGVVSTDTSPDEDLIEFIRQASAEIESYTGRWFSPHPLSGTTTYRLHTTFGRTLFVPKGIRSITTLGIATYDQPASSGVYITADSAGYYIDPPDMERTVGWPGTRIGLTLPGSNIFYNASYGAEITGTFGFASVPYDIQSVALNSVVRHWKARQTGQSDIIGTSDVGGRLLRFISPEERGTLDRYRYLLVA